MNESDIWSVDRLAVSNMLLSVGLKLCPKQELLMAEHFARHRRDAHQWAAERVRERIVHRLENASRELCSRNGDDWVQGFLRAEQAIMTMAQQDLIGMENRKGPSKGQVLRALVRRAKAAAKADAASH